MVVIVVMLYFVYICLAVEKFDGRIFCLENNRLIDSKEEGEFVNVELTAGNAVQLQCSFCNQKANREPKIWIFLNLLTGVKEELNIKGRFSETSLKSLNIANVSSFDAGLYLCQPPYHDSMEDSFNYMLDVTGIENKTSGYRTNIVKYNSSVWHSVVGPTNYILANIGFSLSDESIVKFEITPGWSPWSDCEECVSNPVKRRTAFCRVIPLPLSDISPTSNLSTLNSVYVQAIEILLKTNAALPCHGVLLMQLLPQIAGITAHVPDFVQEEYCEESCPLRGGKRGPRERRVVILREGARALIHCPGPLLVPRALPPNLSPVGDGESWWNLSEVRGFRGTLLFCALLPHRRLVYKTIRKIQSFCNQDGLITRAMNFYSSTAYGDTFRWEFNKRRISGVELDGLVAVDHFGGLHLIDVNKSCRGNYTCFVSHDGEETKAMEVKVMITADDEKEWAALRRHAGYLAIVSVLSYTSFTIVICGIFWKKKRLQRTLAVLQEFELSEPFLSTYPSEMSSSDDVYESDTFHISREEVEERLLSFNL